MLAEANREIRWALEAANHRRNERQRTGRSFAYLDHLIVSLELLHLKGHTELPPSFRPRLEVLSGLLPPGVAAPTRWSRSITRAIDQCFELQEKVLRAQEKYVPWPA